MALSQLTPEELQQALDGPALLPPDGVTPNLVDPPHNNGLAVAVVVVCLTVSTVLVLLRAYSRVVILKSVKLEDVIGLGTFGVYCAYMYCVFRFEHNTGFFVHNWNVPLRKMSEFSYIILIGSNFYAVDIMCIKVCIMLEWLRIFVPGKTRNAFFYSCWAVLIVNTLYYIANIVAVNLACIPYNAIWDLTIEGKCLDQRALEISSAAINLISDVTIMALAQQVIWNLQMTLRKKIGVSLIFAAGIFGCVAGCFRLAVTVNYQKSEDLTYSVSSVIMWAIGEMTCGFLVFCVPATPKLFRPTGVTTKIANALRSLTGGSRKGSSTKGSGSGSWQPNLSGSSRSWRKIQPDPLPLTNLSIDPEVPSDSTENLKSHNYSQSEGIVRTTQLVAIQTRDSGNNVAEEEHNRQHPWVTN